MAKSLREIAADMANFLGGRNLDLRDHDFDSLTVFGNKQPPITAEMTLDELRDWIKDNQAQHGTGGRTWQG